MDLSNRPRQTRRQRGVLTLLLPLLVVSICHAAQAADSETGAESQELRVGIKNAPPFAMRGDDGEWAGISVELWNDIATKAGWRSRWVVMQTPGELIDALEEGQIDVAVGALSLTPAREARIDFSHAFHATGLAIATPLQAQTWMAAARQLLSLAFLRAVGVLAVVLLLVGVVIWWVERKRNEAQFGGTVAEGIGNGFWWSAVTMTTVGYGDKAPITFLGRSLAVVWMFVSVITVSGFTAAIASSLTVNQLSTVVHGVNDLGRARNIAVGASTGEEFLRRRGVPLRVVADPQIGLAALRDGDADAFVHDEPLLRYLLKDERHTIEVLSQSVERQYYAFGIGSEFDSLEQLNLHLLQRIGQPDWQEVLTRHLGSP